LFEQHDKSSPLNLSQYAMLPHNIHIMLLPQITVTSVFHVCSHAAGM